MNNETSKTEQIIAAMHAANATGRIALTHINNDGIEVPTDVAKRFLAAMDRWNAAIEAAAAEGYNAAFLADGTDTARRVEAAILKLKEG